MVGCSFLPSVVFHSPLGQGDSLIILKALGSTSNQSCSNVSWEMRITGLRPGVSSKQECKVNPDYWLSLTIYYYPGRAAGETCWPLEQNQKDKHLNLLVSHNINNSEYSMPHFGSISKKKKIKHLCITSSEGQKVHHKYTSQMLKWGLPSHMPDYFLLQFLILYILLYYIILYIQLQIVTKEYKP